MEEVKNKVITVESLKAKHDYDESTYLKKSGALGTLGITATAAELNKLDGVTTTTAELNYVDGVTSNIQTQLNGKAATHSHPYLPTAGGTMTGNVTFNNNTGVFCKNTSGASRILAKNNASNEYFFGYGGYENNEGKSYFDGNVTYIRSKGDIYVNTTNTESGRVNFNCRLTTPYGKGLGSTDTNGVRRPLIWLSSENHLMLGMNNTTESHTGNTAVFAKNGDIKLYNKSGGVGFMQTEHANFDGYLRPDTDGRICLGREALRWYKMYASSACSTTSDKREKSNIVDIDEYPVEQLFEKLNPKAYTLNIEDSGQKHFGFIAQDVESSLEELGMHEKDLGIIEHSYWTDENGEEKDRYSLSYEEFIPLNTYMIQKQQKEIEDLKVQVAELKSLVENK